MVGEGAGGDVHGGIFRLVSFPILRHASLSFQTSELVVLKMFLHFATTANLEKSG